MSIAGYTHEEITIVYKVVGKGTEILSGMKPGEKIDALCPLGNGYALEEIPDDALLIGGGAGAVPIYFLAKELIRKGKSLRVLRPRRPVRHFERHARTLSAQSGLRVGYISSGCAKMTP